MTRFRAFTAFMLLLTVMGVFEVLGQQPRKPPPPPPDYFPLRVGDWWKYRATHAERPPFDFTITVMKIEKQPDGSNWILVEMVTAYQTIHDWYTKPNGWVLQHREEFVKMGTKVDFRPVKKLIMNPLSVGQTWEWKGKGWNDVDVEESSKVVATEAVEVAAGKFQGRKVEIKVVQAGTPVNKIFWYANWVGMIKWIIEPGPDQTVTELVDYSFKKPK